MIDPEDPQRLLDSSDPATAGLRDVMRAAQRDVGTDAQLARMSARLGAVLAPAAVVATGAAALGGASKLGGSAKLGLVTVALIAAGGGAWLLSTSQPAPPPVPTPSPPVAVVAPVAPLPEPIVAPPAAPSTPQADSAQPPATTPKPADKPTPPAQLSEAELLEQARSALKTDPARALARANQHAARFPGGALVQEREVIAIKALRQLGRTADADSRSESFVKAFPGSAFGRKLKPAP
jgi:outer membrane biosynthesis protein TonB